MQNIQIDVSPLMRLLHVPTNNAFPTEDRMWFELEGETCKVCLTWFINAFCNDFLKSSKGIWDCLIDHLDVSCRFIFNVGEQSVLDLFQHLPNANPVLLHEYYWCQQNQYSAAQDVFEEKQIFMWDLPTSANDYKKVFLTWYEYNCEYHTVRMFDFRVCSRQSFLKQLKQTGTLASLVDEIELKMYGI